MISRADIASLMDEAEGSFRECWRAVSRLRSKEIREGSNDGNLSKALLDFQPTLARTLYDLSEMYRKLHQEKVNVVARKVDLTPEWFGHRLALIARYQHAIKAAISLGKRLGDAFALIFYVSAQDHLLEHGDHPRQFLAPPEIGGLGELAFIERVKVVGGHLVLYHGITTFLRVGDVSYINVKERKVAAIGELKTTKVAEGQLNIRLDAVASSEEDLSFLAEGTHHRDTKEDFSPPPLPQKMKARLAKQVASMGDVFEFSGSEGSMELHHDPRIEELNAFCKELKISTFAYRRIGDGLFLFGTRTAKRSLSSKLLGVPRQTGPRSSRVSYTRRSASWIRNPATMRLWSVPSMTRILNISSHPGWCPFSFGHWMPLPSRTSSFTTQKSTTSTIRLTSWPS